MANRWYEAGYSSGSAGKTLKLHIYTVDTNQNENWTVERADLYLSVTNTAGSWWNNYGSPAYVGINGNDTTRNVAWDARSTGDKLLIGTWDTRVYHNDDGTKSIGISASHNTNLGMGSASLSGTYDCDTIPRYASFTQHYVKARTLNTITIYWSANKSISAWQHSINGGAWQNCDGGNTYIIRNLQPNTTYNIRTRIRIFDSGPWTESGTLTTSTLDLPRISSADEITIGQNLEITYTNPAGTDVEIGLFTNYGQTAIRDYVSVSDGKYTFEFTEQEINNIYAQTPNALYTNLRVYAKTSQNNQTYTTYKEIKFNVDIAENQPEFSNFIFTEQNALVSYLTGGSPALLKGQSMAKVEISTENKAIAKNGATILRYEVVNGNVTKTIEYSDTRDVCIIIEKVENDTFVVKAIDSRGISTPVTVKGEMYNYQMPYISELSFARENGIGTKVFFNLESNFDNTNYPHHLNETDIQFRYKKKSTSTWSYWTNLNGFSGLNVDTQQGKITNKTDGSNWIPEPKARTSYEDLDASLQYQQLSEETYQYFDGSDFVVDKYLEFEIGVEYDIEFKIVDILSEWTRQATLSSGVPATSKVKNNDGYYSIGINKFADKNYSLDIAGNINATKLFYDYVDIKTIIQQMINETIVVDSKLVAEHTFNGSENSYTFNDLDILADGGIYEVYFSGRKDDKADLTLIEFNGITGSQHYIGERIYAVNTVVYASTTSGNNTKLFSYIDVGSSVCKSTIIYETTRNRACWLSYTNSFGNGNVQDHTTGYCNLNNSESQSIDNIKTIRIFSENGSNYVAGSKIQIYKK